MTKRIKLTVAYDGTNYCGWQVQPNGLTVEEVLNRTLRDLTGEEIHIIGASRTDSGVHAQGNVAVFDTDTKIPPKRISYALNQRLPEDIVIVKSEEVTADWHPRYQDHIVKTYEYHIWNGPVKHPLKQRYATHVSFPLNVEAMRKGASYIVGTHDFASFCNVRTNTQDTVRQVYSIEIEEHKNSEAEGLPGNEIIIRVRGNGFLYNMVRIIAGTLIRVGRGFYTPEKIGEILERKERTAEGITAPAGGLVLMNITYET